ncbi:hypothetical protein [Planomonospora venezuelensis]|uniref:Uncharacterized protein n=1 Tax=Planomonospora venezuelensis TaxID=1999 RepID=A0A841D913_PLAVE|nr:hypothetical protein [Planomonospora venezuelensis]MBB5965087.1 hypothetical protein [Planomonospora venezuelensis]GIN04995.1 hypothetical protein Pve01_66530 [Planomonospora venezuelensis]
MKFGDLAPGVLARIPFAENNVFVNPTRALPPAVEILTAPTPCPVAPCEGLEVMAREVDGGRPHLYHRLPERPVTLITPAVAEEAPRHGD